MTDLVFDAWVFGRTTGSKRHAVKRTHSALGYTMHALCGARDNQGMLRATNTPFTPAGHDDICETCSRRWTARHAEEVVGWTKTCSSCGLDRPINQFHVDRRTRDNLSKHCLDCEEGAKQAVQEAQRLLEREANRQRALNVAHKRHQHEVEVLTWWQEGPWGPAFTCTRRHTLTLTTGTRTSESGWAEGLQWPTTQWTCPCGSTETTPEHTQAATEAKKAHDVLEHHRAHHPATLTIT